MTDEYVELVCDDVSHDAVLTDPGVRVLDVAQVVRRLKGLSLWHSKVLVTEVPAVILAGVPEEVAATAVSALREAGAQAETRERPEPEFPTG
ncbi:MULTISPECIES: ribosomal protein L7/L12 [unclassified Streptomyces]|uniref:ribosomal protein L7/L12 n=1 Tax=unclassified Streptomyces TaxID=2593676 RepID=UPI00038293D6|nr:MULTISPECIES: ribosomal protein L7/L12 [unclassified Streptomyces]MYX35043.1 ribosomal protein L7/L12 [Streptomyces sp. SID8377]